MTDPKQIPHLVSLLDDDSPEIRQHITRELMAFGPLLPEALKKLSLPISPLQRIHLDDIFVRQKRLWLRQVWPSWFSLKSDEAKLEKALSLLAFYLSAGERQKPLSSYLDQWTKEYRKIFSQEKIFSLIKFLFIFKGMRGNEEDYYHLQNCNLVSVMQKKKGIPISLASVLILLGNRLGLTIEGCNFPGHFLAKIHINGNDYFVDCFNKGQVLVAKDILRLRQNVGDTMEMVLREKVTAHMIVRRFVANLIRAYHVQGAKEDSELMIALFKAIDQYEAQFDFLGTPNKELMPQPSRFYPGDLVSHRTYGYRGIIVDVDLQCQATDVWYYGNQMQPNRQQPWYHLLIHDSDHVTYVAENHITLDLKQKIITHPLLNVFFAQSRAGQYIRNEHPWPETRF